MICYIFTQPVQLIGTPLLNKVLSDIKFNPCFTAYLVNDQLNLNDI